MDLLYLRICVCMLSHWGRVTHTCISKLTIIGSDNGPVPSHYLNKCLNIVNWTLGNKLISPLCHIYVSVDLVSIGSDNGLLPFQRQATIRTNARLLSIGPLGTNFSEISIAIYMFSSMKMSSGNWRAILSRPRRVIQCSTRKWEPVF